MKSPIASAGPAPTRRDFLAALGAAAIAAQAPALKGAQAATAATHSAAAPSGAADWAAVRKSFLLRDGLAYFQTGSLGPTPRQVMAASADAWRAIEAVPSLQAFGPWEEKLEPVRAKSAAFLGCDLDEIAVTRNTTDGMNTVAQGLELQRDDHVLTTDHEHPGGFFAWEYYVKRRGIVLDRVKLPYAALAGGSVGAADLVKLFEAAMTKSTRVISVSHVLFSTGLRLPIARLAALARSRGALLVVDGAQAVGAMSVNVKELGCDAYACSGHKWMLGPMGTGLLYIAKAAQAKIDPLLLSSGRGVYTAITGTRDIPGTIGLGAAIDFLTGFGPGAVEGRVMALRARLYDGLTGITKLKVVSPRTGEMASPIVSVELPKGVDSSAVADRLEKEHNAVVKVIPGEMLNGLRISPHVCTDEKDVDQLIGGLQEVLA